MGKRFNGEDKCMSQKQDGEESHFYGCKIVLR
jgi:hypothetical protein